MSGDTGPVVDLGTCEGCGLGCALACAGDATGVATGARSVLVATGVGLVPLALVPVVAADGWLRAVAVLLATLGVAVAILAFLAPRTAPRTGDRLAGVAYRLVPLGVGGVLASWVATAVGLLAR